MRQAIEASQQLDDEMKRKLTKEDEEEAEMIRQAIEMSAREEEERKKAE